MEHDVYRRVGVDCRRTRTERLTAAAAVVSVCPRQNPKNITLSLVAAPTPPPPSLSDFEEIRDRTAVFFRRAARRVERRGLPRAPSIAFYAVKTKNSVRVLIPFP